MFGFRSDPGPCPICGAPHAACTATSGPVTVQQLPARDAMLATAQSQEPPAELRPPPAFMPPDPDEEVVTTATYRGDPKRRRR